MKVNVAFLYCLTFNENIGEEIQPLKLHQQTFLQAVSGLKVKTIINKFLLYFYNNVKEI